MKAASGQPQESEAHHHYEQHHHHHHDEVKTTGGFQTLLKKALDNQKLPMS